MTAEVDRSGTVIAGRFVLETLAGAGGMGAVYRARDERTGGKVALKLLRRDSTELARFEREAVALSRIDHPRVVRYITHGRADTGEPFLAMEWLEGHDLAHQLRKGPLAIPDLLHLARTLAGILAALHEHGVIHRDIKPSNLFLPHGDLAALTLLDFGIVRLASSTDTQTGTGAVLGTPAYMAPEQARGERDLDARADMFATGCVLYECAAGRPPFVGDGPIAVLAKVLLDYPPALHEARADVPAALAALISRLLAKAPAERPADGRALAAALEQLEIAPVVATRAPVIGISTAELRVVSVVVAAGAIATDETQPASVEQPEEREALARVTAAGGKIVRLAGGALVACYSGAGSPRDLAQRAASCALDWRARFSDRAVAVATGRAAVVARLPVGEAIDRAVRLARTATAGQVAVDPTTASLLEGRFEVAGDGERRFVKRALVDEPARALLGRPTPCVGRERELALLGSLADEAFAEPGARAALVIAPAGTGKTRLVHELLSTLRPRGIEIARARLDASSPGASLGAIAALVHELARIEPASSPHDRWLALSGRVAAQLPASEARRTSEFLAELVGADPGAELDAAVVAAHGDPSLMADGVRAAFVDWVCARCATAPLVLLVEDLHWADAPSVRMLDALLERARDLPLLLIATARPELQAVWTTREVQEIRLGALPRRAAMRLVESVLPGVEAAVVEELVARAGGHPFYVEELVRAFASGASHTVLPDSVLGMLQMRLDALGEAPKRTLRAASVFGQTFRDAGVRALAEDLGDPRALLDELVHKEIIEPRGNGYAFRHALVRDAAYATIPDGDRVRAHALAGAWLETTGDVSPGMLADHYIRGERPERAAPWYVAAAEKALEINDLAGCLAAAERARNCTVLADLLARIDLLVAEATYWSGDPGAAAPIAERAFEHLEPMTPPWFRAATTLVNSHGQRGENAAVHAVASRVAAAGDGPGVVAVLARTVSQLAWGAPELVASHAARLEALAPDPEAFEPVLAGRILHARASRIAVLGYDLAGGARLMERATHAFDVAHAPREAAMASIMGLGWRAMVGSRPAIESLVALIKDLERAGNTYGASFARMVHGQMLAAHGPPEHAVEILEGLAPAVRGHTRIECHVWTALGLAYWQLERLHDAVEASRRASTLPVGGRLLACAMAPAVLAQVGLCEVAVATLGARRALELDASSQRWEAYDGLVPYAAAIAFRAAGDRNAAVEALSQSRISRLEAHLPPEMLAEFRAVRVPHMVAAQLAADLQ